MSVQLGGAERVSRISGRERSGNYVINNARVRPCESAMPRRAINSGPSPQLLSHAEKLFADVFTERANPTCRSQRTCRFAGGKCFARRSAVPSLGLHVVVVNDAKRNYIWRHRRIESAGEHVRLKATKYVALPY